MRDYCRAVTDEAGVVRFYDGILVDITAEKRAGEALRQSERDYRQLFESAHDAILIFAVDDERFSKRTSGPASSTASSAPSWSGCRWRS